jgi:hypothetical protein
MSQRHKHADVIIAWANGEEIEWRSENSRNWFPINWSNPSWNDCVEYRIKPKRVKKEGWIGVRNTWTTERVYETEKECRADCNGSAAIIRIEWEEDA